MYIEQHCITEITNACRIEDVIGEITPLKGRGAKLEGICPGCGAKKLNVSKAKDIWKCYSCDVGGKGSISFVMKYKTNDDYINAIKYLASKYNIHLEYQQTNIIDQVQELAKQEKRKRTTESKIATFRDQQLASSGLTEADQKYNRILEGSGKDDFSVMDRYQSATINKKWEVIPGDDMILHYMDLHGKPMTYQKERSSKDFPLIRVRWSNPDLHKDKHDKPIKYQSPFGSKNAVWINDKIRELFKNKQSFDTLYVPEGEKKADKSTKHGLYSMGVQGIHNIAHEKQLAPEFQWVIKNCSVKNVIFFIDADWDDLSDKPEKPIDSRPRTFMSAIRNFREYFYAFNNNNIELNIYFAYPRPEHDQKGVDDLLNTVLKGKEDLLREEFKKLLIDPKGEGEYVNCHKITSWSDTKFKEFFHLTTKEDFVKHHKEKLKDRVTFLYGSERFKFSNAEEHPDHPPGSLILAMPLSKSEEYWDEEIIERPKGPAKTILKFNHTRCYNFLRNKSFGRLKFKGTGTRYIKIDGNIVREVEHTDIRDYVVDFTENTLEKANLLESLYRAAQHLGPISLTNLKFINPQFPKSSKNTQNLYFGETFWTINAEGIKEDKIADLSHHVWEDKLIDFNAKLAVPLVQVKRSDDARTSKYNLIMHSPSEETPKSDFLDYLWKSSNFFWEQTGEGYSKIKDPSGKNKRKLDDFEIEDHKMHFISKLTAIGYLLHSHYDASTRKMVIGMDGKQSEVGKSNGRSGKSLLGQMLKHITPTITVNGKKKDLADDRFVFGKVTEKTNIVFIDDMRVNVDIEHFFAYITGSWDVQEKGQVSLTIPEADSPKLYGTTNHALNGEGGSFRARLFFIAFSDYFNENYSPVDEYGCLFYEEWDYAQKNLFFNAAACCLQIYLEHGLISAPMERIEQRRLRQQIGETFLDWADQYFDPEKKSGADGIMNLGRDIPRHEITEDFYSYDLNNKKYTDVRRFKEKIKMYCTYKKYTFNPIKDGADHKSNGTEYFTIMDPMRNVDPPKDVPF